MRELSLHLLDIAENSIAAGAKNIIITIREDTKNDRLYLSVLDDGKGMDEEMVARVTDPFVTTRTTRKVGLGIPLLKAAAESCNGWLKIHSKPGQGTLLEVEFQRSHIDRMPLGDIAGTFLTLLVGNPQIHWVFRYTIDHETFELDDQTIKQELEDIPLSDPKVLSFLRELLENGLHALQIASVT
ncbi:MAG: ATP-binding protein [Chloroflexota bacterium]